jgi:hypothetical protein
MKMFELLKQSYYQDLVRPSIYRGEINIEHEFFVQYSFITLIIYASCLKHFIFLRIE